MVQVFPAPLTTTNVQALIDAETAGDVATAIAAEATARNAAIAAALPRFDAPISGRYYDCETYAAYGTATTTATAMTAGRLYATKVILPPGTYTKLGVSVGTNVAATTVRSFVYTNGTTGLPDALLIDGGADLDSSTTGEKEHTISLVLTVPTFLWLATYSNGAPSIAGYSTAVQAAHGFTAGNNTSRQNTVFRDVSYGSPPNPFGAVSYTSTALPRIWVRL